MVAGEPRETIKAAGGMSAQRNFLASVLKPGKRQNLSVPQQVISHLVTDDLNAALFELDLLDSLQSHQSIILRCCCDAVHMVLLCCLRCRSAQDEQQA